MAIASSLNPANLANLAYSITDNATYAQNFSNGIKKNSGGSHGSSSSSGDDEGSSGVSGSGRGHGSSGGYYGGNPAGYSNNAAGLSLSNLNKNTATRLTAIALATALFGGLGAL